MRRTRGTRRREIRRRRHPIFNFHVLTRTAAGLAPLLAIAGLVWLWESGWFGRQFDRVTEAAYAVSAHAGLKVNELLVEGREQTSAEAVLRALGISRDMPILKLDPEESKATLESLPWVKSASVSRRLPDVVYVQLEERQAMALWQLDGKLSVIDWNGDVILDVAARKFAGLPLVVGPGAPAETADLLKVLHSEPKLKERVIAAVWVSSRRWNLQLRGGIDVRLPEGGLREAWAQLARIEREYGVLDRDVTLIDMRIPDRLVVRTAPGAEIDAPEGAGGEST